ncbi:MAG TPA: efflux RND transporter periplasmic adaptor subunit, partial [Methylomirabilota bacterium]|nr:efflux RND transporter periplasmic adaptor subunit [Methylomirabilota bacterium]
TAALVFVMVVVAGFFALRFSRATSAVTVSVGTAEATGGGSATGAGISANGYVVARTKASVSSKVLGRLSWVGITEGSEVKVNEVIARLESADYEAALLAANANVAQLDAQHVQAQRDLKRAQSLRAQDLVSDADLESAQTRVEVSLAQANAGRAQARLAEATLENTRVRAPFTGTVLRKDAEVGEIVAPSSAGGGLTRTAIVTMADLSTLEVEVDVNEAYIAQVVNGQPARITLDAYPDTSFAGRVRQVVPTADRQKATVLVKVSILDRDPRILPEMGAKVVFEARDAQVVAAPRRVFVPQAALVQSGGRASVWVMENDKVRQQAVDVGPARGDRIEVRQGLLGGESLVLSPPAGLKDGTKVKLAAR